MDEGRPVLFSCNHPCSDEDLLEIPLLDGVIVLCPACYKLVTGDVIQSILMEALHEHMQANLKFEL